MAAIALKPTGPGVPTSKYILMFVTFPKNTSVTLKTATEDNTAIGYWTLPRTDSSEVAVSPVKPVPWNLML